MQQKLREHQMRQDSEGYGDSRMTQNDMNQKKKENSITSGIEKFLRSFKTKEIKPLHLDRHTEGQLMELGVQGRVLFEFQSYNSVALRRFTNLFIRDTKIKLQELEDQNIDFHGIQMLNA